MGAVAKTVAFILIGLSVITLYLFIERLITFAKAKRRSKEVAPKLADMLKKGQIKEALALSTKKSGERMRESRNHIHPRVEKRNKHLRYSGNFISVYWPLWNNFRYH